MKKIFLAISFIVILSLGNAVSARAEGIAVYKGPNDTFKILMNQISALADWKFTYPKAADQQKKSLSRQILALNEKVENGAYGSAIRTLDQEIRNRVWQWIAAAEQKDLFQSIDNAIAAVDNAAQSTLILPDGKVAGADATLNCWAWKGIPFAKPPVGELRWRAPQDPTPWRKIRQYTEEYSHCTQPLYSNEWAPLNQITGSEDCLYLDIYAPRNPIGKLPVYFYIHGGGNMMGGAGDTPWCSILAYLSNVVVVIPQYRLGPFGFFNHPALNPQGTPGEKSGNFGMLDQIKALEWVQKNIAYFNGDPGNVMITGISAGGLNTLNLMISPLAKGLFHKALVQSAGPDNVQASTGVVRANTIIDKLLVADGTRKDLNQAADLRASMSKAQIEAYLKKKTGEQILRVMMDDKGWCETVNPFIDKAVVPGRIVEVFERGDYNRVPVILGCNEYEMKPNLHNVFGMVPTSNGFTWSKILNVLGLADPPMTLDQLMPDPDDRALYEACGKYPSLNWKAAMVDGLARQLKKHQNQVYCYWFKWGGPGSAPAPVDFLIGAGHAFEIPFFFAYPDCVWRVSFTEANYEGRHALTGAIVSYVASFIGTGNPNQAGNGLPVWEEWSNNPGASKSIILDADYTRTKISMMNQEFTKEEIMAQIYSFPPKERDLILALIWM